MKPSISPFTLTVTFPGSGNTRTLRLGPRRYEIFRISLFAAAVLQVTVAGGLAWFMHKAAAVDELVAEMATLEEQRSIALRLATRVQTLEREYERLRAAYTHVEGGGDGEPWLFSYGGDAEGPSVSGDISAAPGDNLPMWEWPLVEKGIVTREPSTDNGTHPGIDVAVANGTYVIASRPGIVVEVGEDEVYGRYVLLDHGEGYSTRYAHLSMTLVEPGTQVRGREVIALSGSTGISTGPHLHFEIRMNGALRNPFDFVKPPN